MHKLSKYREELGINALVNVELLERRSSDTNSAPSQVIELLEEYLRLRRLDGDDRLLLNPDYSHYRFGKFIEGEEYALFLKQLVENEFHTMLSDFENDVNPFDEEATKYKLPRHEESIKKRCRKLKERIEDIKEGEEHSNHRKEE